MRPVDTSAIAMENQENRGVAKRMLAEQIGWFCSYCELPIQNHPNLEHAEAIIHGGNLTALENNLLACSLCNSNKNAKISRRDQCIWPDQDNTFRAFVYEANGMVKVADNLDNGVSRKAKTLYDACALGKKPTSRQRSVDNRWDERTTAWTKALDEKEGWQKYDKNETNPQQKSYRIKQIVAIADGSGFFSVWMTVFSDEPEIKIALIHHFKGTASDCFDNAGNAVPRPNGNI